MEFRHLRYFEAVARNLSFTVAARELGVSQPPLSQQIRDLESELGTDLFERTSRRVALTRAGVELLRRAREIMNQMEHTAVAIRAIGSGRSGLLNVGLTSSILCGPLGRIFARFSQALPDVEVRIHEMAPDEQIHALRSRRTELSFLRCPPQQSELAVELAWQERIRVALPRDHPLAGRLAVGLEELSDETFIFLRMKDSRFAHYLYDACMTHGFAPRISQQVVESQALLNLVVARFGIALVPASVSRYHHPGLIYTELSGKAPNANVYAVHRADEVSIVPQFLEVMRLHALRDSDISPLNPDKY